MQINNKNIYNFSSISTKFSEESNDSKSKKVIGQRIFYVNDEEKLRENYVFDLAKTVDRFNERYIGRDVPVNKNHDYGEAVGWITALYLSDDSMELLADIEYTKEGAEFLTSKKYRYFSCEFEFLVSFVKDDEFYYEDAVLIGGALTNYPAMPNTQLQLSEKNKAIGDAKMEKDKLAQDLTVLTVENETLKKQLSEFQAKSEEFSKKASESIDLLGKEIASLQEEKKVLLSDKFDKDLDVLFSKALDEGKCFPAEKEVILSFAKAVGIEGTSEWLEKRPSIAKFSKETGDADSENKFEEKDIFKSSIYN
jgi:phage I-like protein